MLTLHESLAAVLLLSPLCSSLWQEAVGLFGVEGFLGSLDAPPPAWSRSHLPLLEDSTAWEGFLQGGELMITLGGISLVRFWCVCAGGPSDLPHQ